MSLVTSNRMRWYREQRRLSLQDLADAAGCSKTHIWELEQNRSPMEGCSWRLLCSIAAALGISIMRLMEEAPPSPVWPEPIALAEDAP